MAGPCTVCSHPEASLTSTRPSSVRPGSWRRQAAFAKSAVHRHRSHIGALPAGARPVETGATATKSDAFRPEIGAQSGETSAVPPGQAKLS